MIPADPLRNLGPATILRADATGQCECDPCTYQVRENVGKRCQRPAADYGSVKTSPALCTACLFGCAE